jgi:hypothetical protein
MTNSKNWGSWIGFKIGVKRLKKWHERKFCLKKFTKWQMFSEFCCVPLDMKMKWSEVKCDEVGGSFEVFHFWRREQQQNSNGTWHVVFVTSFLSIKIIFSFSLFLFFSLFVLLRFGLLFWCSVFQSQFLMAQIFLLFDVRYMLWWVGWSGILSTCWYNEKWESWRRSNVFTTTKISRKFFQKTWRENFSKRKISFSFSF